MAKSASLALFDPCQCYSIDGTHALGQTTHGEGNDENLQNETNREKTGGQIGQFDWVDLDVLVNVTTGGKIKVDAHIEEHINDAIVSHEIQGHRAGLICGNAFQAHVQERWDSNLQFALKSTINSL